MVNTRKRRTPARRRIQHGGVNNDSPRVEINIFLKVIKEDFDDDFVVGLTEKDIKDTILDTQVPIHMVRDMFARAQANGVPQFSQIISAEFDDDDGAFENDDERSGEFNIKVVVRTDLTNQEIENYFLGYNLENEQAEDIDNGWVSFEPATGIKLATTDFVGNNIGDRILIRRNLVDNQIPNIPLGNNQNGGARRRKRKSRRVTRKKRRSGRR